MRRCSLAFAAALLALVTGSAYASKITMGGGRGSIPFTTLNFNITLDSSATLCLDANNNPVPCVFQNEVNQTVTQIDLTFEIPSGDKDFTCGILAGSPFSDCSVAFATITPSSPGSTDVIDEAIFKFFDGSLPNTNEFSLNFAGFKGGDTFGGKAIVSNPTPEPGSAILLLTALGGALIALRQMRRSVRSRA
jgi:hypothetical protein